MNYPDKGLLNNKEIERQSFSKILLTVFLSPLILLLVYLFVYFLYRGEILVNSPSIILIFLAVLYVFPVVSFILYKTILFGFFKDLSEKLLKNKIKKNKSLVSDKLKIFNFSQEEDISKEIESGISFLINKQIDNFSKASGIWSIGKDGSFIFPVDDTYYLKKIDLYKKNKTKAGKTSFGLLAIVIDVNEGSFKSPKEIFNFYSMLIELVNKTVASYGGFVYFFSGHSICTIFNEGWSSKETAVRTIKASKDIDEKIKKIKKGFEYQILVDLLSGTDGFWASESSYKYYIISKDINNLWLKSTPLDKSGFKISQRIVEKVRG
ncbi:MAG: hypothetical protein KAR07_04210 [Spirochaetes bacterium]|nr:hypothetical protein [Spirochaetota bacterium]